MLTQRQPALATDIESPSPDEELPPSSARVPTAILWRAAADAESGVSSTDGLTLPEIWEQFVLGFLRIGGSYALGDRVYLLARSAGPAERAQLTRTEAAVLVRVLCGEQQKAVAADLSIAPSTASHRCVGALDKVGVAGGPVPLPLIVAAQNACSVQRVPEARCLRFEHEGSVCTIVSVRRPDLGGVDALTRAEQEVACLFIEGRSRAQIARHRRTSALTVAGQVHAIFSALRVSGRYALVRRAGELGCFARPSTREEKR
jgi:DNA-binding NarL/FixJ family response regulator